MKCSEIVNYVMEQRALHRTAQPQPAINSGGKAVPNRPLKKRRKPISSPVLMTFSLPPKQMLLDQDVDLEQRPNK